MAEAGRPRVAVVYGAVPEQDVMSRVGAMLERFGIDYEETMISPHRSPRTLHEWCAGLEAHGVQVVIAGGGVNAGLAGIVASYTSLPVIGVPITGGGLNGLDALLSMTSMSAGVPVACVGLDHSTNAAVLAVQILALGDERLRTELARFKEAFEASARG
ncbi:MAG TPA: AIR carboxylase family protein [Mycobacteriales bacterium]|nr:AIR carboxylase family protein [Mycobacteriales bacterium]